MTPYICHIDEANSRVNALEKQQGLTQSEFIDNLDVCNQRIAQLEGSTATSSAPITQAAAPVESLAALKKRRFELCGYLGIEMQYQGECKTAADYKASIAKLEARLKPRLTAQAPARVVETPKPFNATIARFNTGKTTGLEKAIGAAANRAN